jgi:hypothetical protein
MNRNATRAAATEQRIADRLSTVQEQPYLVYRRDDDGRLFRYGDSFPDQGSAVAFAKDAIGYDWRVKQKGQRFRASDPRFPLPKSPAERRRAANESIARMRGSGYRASGAVPGGGQYEWTITFPTAAHAQGFVEAVRERARRGDDVRAAVARGNLVDLVSGPNFWPANLFAAELATYGGAHPYQQ